MTITAGHQPTAAELEELRNSVRAGVTLARVAVQGITTGGSAQSISWDTVRADNVPVSFITVPSTTILIPAGYGGTYDIGFGVYGGNFVNRAFLQVVPTVSAITYPAQLRNVLDLQEDMGWIGCPGVRLDAGDSVVSQCFHTTGSTVNVTAFMSCYRTGP